jgi:hypothetical protein
MKLLFCIGLLILGCSKGGEPAKQPTEAEPAPMPQSAPECVDEEGDPVECETDADCCKGFACGKDPEQTFRAKFCLYAG